MGRKARQGIPDDLVIEIRDAAPDVDSLDSASSTDSVDSVSSMSSVGSIDSPNNAEGTNSTTASLLTPIPSATATNDTLTNKAKQSDSGQVGVHIALPVVLSVGVTGALLFFLWRWYKRCHPDKSSGIDQATLAGGAAPMGQHDQTRFRSDESVMADLMDAAYAAENGGLRNSQMTRPRPNGVFADEKMTARHQIRQMDGPQASLSPRTRGPVFSWLGGVRSGAPTVRGSVAVPQSVVSSDRSTIAAWPRNLEPTNYPIRYMEQERIRPSSPAQTAITQNASAHTESSWNTWGVEQYRPSEKKKGLLGRLKAGLTGSL
ncbi:hypothetical protein CMQ_44 [Grosmannia clavigera kw1407]|uniref:Uncharacterized protein n=1 Tax=Grosmannia clavigera (strain kw1407 / UAMH 11150) TaxID=655863 RepID=F0XQS4_GROCL|nr:uncharacterized protein CMQ_44 [Grosmannia clavigera kw1407]EFW99726.1 hypothetical protein CMQ_44 [Grosmannia clavigera kw1407]